MLRDVEVLRARLAAIVRSAKQLSLHLEDLHVIAYDQAAAGELKVAGGTASDVGDVGDERARALWKRMEAELRTAELIVVGMERMTGNLLSEGPSPEPTRGSLIRKAELKSELKRQRRRQERGEYSPRRLMDQPPYPGAS